MPRERASRQRPPLDRRTRFCRVGDRSFRRSGNQRGLGGPGGHERHFPKVCGFTPPPSPSRAFLQYVFVGFLPGALPPAPSRFRVEVESLRRWAGPGNPEGQIYFQVRSHFGSSRSSEAPPSLFWASLLPCPPRAPLTAWSLWLRLRLFRSGPCRTQCPQVVPRGRGPLRRMCCPQALFRRGSRQPRRRSTCAFRAISRSMPGGRGSKHFCLSSRIAHATRQERIHALAAKEGVDPARTWAQFFEAFPRAARYHKECGDTRQSWISCLEACCRQSRHPRDDYLFVWSAKSILFYCSHIGPSLCLPFANLRWLHHGRSGKQ